jgi:hypothetical protein
MGLAVELTMAVTAGLTQSKICYIISDWLASRLPQENWHWLRDSLVEIAQGRCDDRTIYTTFSLIPRRLGKQDVNLRLAELADLGWHPQNWSVDQLGRSLLLLNLPQENNEAQVKHWFEQLYTTAGIRELVALHQTLPLLPHPERYRFWADEGVRSHMKGVFEAIAHHNSYPASHFPEAAWNDLILKTIFIGAPLQPIYGLQSRANPTLARMLVDYMAERQAAGRSLSPELWPLVEPFLGDIPQDRAKTLEIYRSQLPLADDGIPQANRA